MKRSVKLGAIWIGLLLSGSLSAQNAIKLYKQQTNFFYTQLNLHAGFMSDINGERWDIANRGPSNQLVFQWKNKNKKNLQKGYVRSIAYKGFKIKAGISYNKSVNALGSRMGGLKLKFFDTFLDFGSKWDRTSFKVGLKSIPFGHNPKLDPVSSFATNLIKMDLGLVQDLGIFIKTPFASDLDLEMSLTSGGVLNKPFVVCENLINYDNEPENVTTVRLNEFTYDGTWLVTGRLGNPSYKRNELGFVFTSGRISNTNVRNDQVDILRFGGDWVYKHRESFKFSSLATIGSSHSLKEGDFTSVNLQATMDLFFIRKIVLSGSYALNKLSPSDYQEFYHQNNTGTMSVTYTLSPHTRLRLNSYYTHIKEADEDQSGVFLQFVTGFGKR